MKKEFQKRAIQIQAALWRWSIRKLRPIVDAVDDWLHAEEVKIRAVPTIVATSARADEFQVAATRAREKVHKRAARPRLRYRDGQFVREGI